MRWGGTSDHGITGAFSQIIVDRATVIWDTTCPDVHGTTKFIATEYIDRWYNLANSPFPFMNNLDTCPWANYTLMDDGTVKVVNSEIRWTDGVRKYATGTAVLNENEPGTLSVAFGPIQPTSTGENYIVLDTDNTQFSYVWSCADICEATRCGSRPLLWVLDRDYSYTTAEVNAKVDEALAIVRNFGYSESSIETVKSLVHVSVQENCDY